MRSPGRWIAFCIAALVALTAVSPMVVAPAQAEQAAADEPSAAEVSQRTKLRAAIPGKAYSRERVIEELRDEKRKIRQATEAGVEIMNAEVDAEYARLARRMELTVSQLTQNLAEEGVSPETVKHLLRANIAWERYQKEHRKAR